MKMEDYTSNIDFTSLNRPTMILSPPSTNPLLEDMKGFSEHFTKCRKTTGGQECPLSYENSSQVVPIVKLPKSTPIP